MSKQEVIFNALQIRYIKDSVKFTMKLNHILKEVS